jgi:hypothetical protein
MKSKKRINANIKVYLILISCLGALGATIISILYGPILDTDPNQGQISSSPSIIHSSNVDFGSVNGRIINSVGSPIEGATVHVYKHTGLDNLVDKNEGYSASALTGVDGSYELTNLPSGVYKLTVTYPDGGVQAIENYAVWPSSSSSYVIKELK